jgi:hypothetical protein
MTRLIEADDDGEVFWAVGCRTAVQSGNAAKAVVRIVCLSVAAVCALL